MTQEVLINLDGKAKGDGESIKLCLISEDVHDGTIEEVVNLKGSNFDSGAEEEKIVINVKPNGFEGIISKWCSTKITKGSGTYSSSTLYVIAEKAKLLDQIKDQQENLTTAEMLAKFFNEKLKGKKCKVLTKTVTSKADATKKYSKIDKFISFE